MMADAVDCGEGIAKKVLEANAKWDRGGFELIDAASRERPFAIKTDDYVSPFVLRVIRENGYTVVGVSHNDNSTLIHIGEASGQ